MKLRFWGTRGSLPSPRPGPARNGGSQALALAEAAEVATLTMGRT